jgi:hypothetical protein
VSDGGAAPAGSGGEAPSGKKRNLGSNVFAKKSEGSARLNGLKGLWI